MSAAALTTVLLIDDDALQLRIREAVLRRGGFSVAVATSAEIALALLRAPGDRSFGAILTDHMLPRVSGAEFVRQLRALDPTVPVIVITGLPEAEEEYDGLNIHFRQKPCDPEDLIALVKRLTSDS